eukprot:TRINITY_DN9320_c2_g1_i1.p1 TRINITY_DN9320_c2_g1~~TRINITY_DN9320_c2_g1_i1.p1  ORF type:complete len:228 (+),score=57.64 TRINITY_DN9320_c2_g1_i1:139-822(+)
MQTTEHKTLKAIFINGSPRKNWNTAQMLNSAAEGAKTKGAEVEIVHLYDLNFKGCSSCFACKLKDGKSLGRCAKMDEITPILRRIEECDILILGSPVYFGGMTGEMKSFMERLLYPYNQYTKDLSSLFPRKVQTALIGTMNVSEESMKSRGGNYEFKIMESFLSRIFKTPCETLFAFDTKQFPDYSKYVCEVFDADAKLARHNEVFPEDLKKAFELGAKLATNALAQ